MNFIKDFAEQIITACIHAKEENRMSDSSRLSGGVFQNALLLRLTEDGINWKGFSCTDTSADSTE